MSILKVRGTNDFLPKDTAKWHVIEGLLHQLCREYGYGEIRTPIFENTELFIRGVGDTTDIVQKEKVNRFGFVKYGRLRRVVSKAFF